MKAGIIVRIETEDGYEDADITKVAAVYHLEFLDSFLEGQNYAWTKECIRKLATLLYYEGDE